MSFEIKEVSDTRPPKPDPFEGLAKVLEGMAIGASKTVKIEGDSLATESFPKLCARVGSALRRYAAQQGVGVRGIGFEAGPDNLSVWWTKAEKIVRKKKAAEPPAPPGSGDMSGASASPGSTPMSKKKAAK